MGTVLKQFDLGRKTTEEQESDLLDEFRGKNNFRDRNPNLDAQSAESEVKVTERNVEVLFEPRPGIFR